MTQRVTTGRKACHGRRRHCAPNVDTEAETAGCTSQVAPTWTCLLIQLPDKAHCQTRDETKHWLYMGGHNIVLLSAVAGC
jgi:hypothetical protein